jgi:hypothetical protein
MSSGLMKTEPGFVMETVVEGDGDEDCSVANSSCECALFMDGLPSDFSSNPQLAALASFLEEDKEEKGQKQPAVLRSPLRTQVGGGKARSASSCARQSTKWAPYRVPDKRKSTNTTIGETELFLKMLKF